MPSSDSADAASGPQVDSRALLRALARAARTFDDTALLAHEVEARLLERLDLTQASPERILISDARSGSGARSLGRRFPKAGKYLTDPSPLMLAEGRRRKGWLSRQHACAAWSRSLPFPAATFELLWSNLGLQWANDLDGVLREAHRVLAGEGLLMFASLGPDTLAELRDALPVAFDRAPEMPLFVDMHDVGDALSRAGFEGVVMENEIITMTYPDVRTLLADARATASGALLTDRPRGLLTSRRLAALEEALPRERGRIPARFEVVYGHAWRPASGGVAADASGTARIGVDQIGRTGSV